MADESHPAAGLNSHAGGLAAAFLSIDEEQAQAICHAHFDVVGDAQRFATEKDDTFRIDARDGRQFVLKVANPEEDPAEIDFQVELLRHIEREAPGLPVPRVFTSVEGQTIVKVEAQPGTTRLARLLSYMPGTPLIHTTSSPSQRAKIGVLLARLRHATSNFSHAVDQRIVAWDTKHLPSLRHLLDEIDDRDRRRKLVQAMDRFAAIEPRLAQCRTQVLHNDFNTSNIVVSHEASDFVTGIIDFGDAVRTAIAVDISTAMMNQFPRSTPSDPAFDLMADARDLLRGYLQETDLTQEELALVPTLAMGRVVTRALLSTWRAKMFPGNKQYLLRNTEPGWAHLDWFLARPVEEISALLLA